MNAEIWVQYVFDFLALLAILAAAYNWHMFSRLPGGEDTGEAPAGFAPLAKKAASLTALGLVLFVCGELIGEFASLPDIP
jgi:hypothetical protein